MRIAIWHNLPSGGGKRALYDHVSGLLKRGHSIEAWSPPVADNGFLQLGDLVPEHIVPMAIEGVSLERIVNRISLDSTSVLVRMRAMEQHVQRCADAINKAGFDVFLSGSSIEFAVTGVARYVNLPTVLYLQEPARNLYEAMPKLPWPAPDRDYRRFLHPRLQVREAIGLRALRIQAREELRNARAFDRVLTNSLFSRESLLRAYGIEARVCYLGVDTDRYVDRGKPRERLVVGIGSFSRHKRLEAVIEAIANVTTSRPTLVWIGNAVDETYLKEVTRLAVLRGVAFSPLIDVPHSEVVDVLNRAAAMIYAPRLEPFGYAPLEAGACGVPVVAKSEGGVRESVIHDTTGILVDEDSDLTAGLLRVLDEESLGERLRTAARRNVESAWSLAGATQRLENHLIEVVDNRG